MSNDEVKENVIREFTIFDGDDNVLTASLDTEGDATITMHPHGQHEGTVQAVFSHAHLRRWLERCLSVQSDLLQWAQPPKRPIIGHRSMKVEHIYLDMDGVLADWITGAALLFAVDPGALKRDWGLESDICPQLGITREMLWSRIDCAGEDFWAGLPAFPWARGLYMRMSELAPTTVLSSPSKHPSCLTGKSRWLNEYLGSPGRPFRRYLFGPDKEVVAAPGRVLVDDRESMCRDWEAAGGIAILFPAPSNRRRMELSLDDHRLGSPPSLVLNELAALCMEGR